MIKRLILILLVFISTSGYSQTDILQQYVEKGLENNLALKQRQFSLKQSMEALKQARGMFLPSINVEARYSRAGGGRVIDIPVGDLMNPLYSTLNELLTKVGEPPMFPSDIPNEHIPFLREEEHDTKIRVIQPLFQPAIYYNYQIKSQLNSIQQAEFAIYKHQLAADIKTAYFNYLKTIRVVELYQRTLLLLNENLRVSESLFQNDKATEDVVFQARAELSSLEQQLYEAQKNEKLAAAYFNFLLNRPLDSPIEIVEQFSTNYDPDFDLDEAQQHALKNRDEFNQLCSAINAASNGIKISTSSFLPEVNGVFDYGYQGEKYNITNRDDYWMASLVLQWNLFNGCQDKTRRSQAVLEKKKYELKFEELEQQIKLEVQQAYDNLIVARKSIQTANDRLNSAQKSFKIVNKKYEQGMAPYIEFLNARNSLTSAEVNHIIVYYDYLIKSVEFEKIIAL